VAKKFGPPIIDIDHASTIKDVAARLVGVGNVCWIPEVEQRPEREKHIAALVSDRRAAVAAADLARQNMCRLIELAIVTNQPIETAHEAHIQLMKNDRPLKRRTVKSLALLTMAELGVDRIGSHLERHGSAKTARGPLGDERLIRAAVRRLSFPSLDRLAPWIWLAPCLANALVKLNR
jgi:hypothetical protein